MQCREETRTLVLFSPCELIEKLLCSFLSILKPELDSESQRHDNDQLQGDKDEEKSVSHFLRSGRWNWQRTVLAPPLPEKDSFTVAHVLFLKATVYHGQLVNLQL